MTPFEEEVLFTALPKVMAWERLHDPEFGGKLDAEGIYDQCLAAGYDEATAGEWARQRALERMRKDLPA